MIKAYITNVLFIVVILCVCSKEKILLKSCASTPPKTYWSIVNKLMGKKKIPAIPPIRHEGLLETNFERKADVFNTFFANQCTTWINTSVFRTEKCINSLEFTREDIRCIIKHLNPNRAHGHDYISIRMDYAEIQSHFLFLKSS